MEVIGWVGGSYVIDVALSHECGAAMEGKGSESGTDAVL